MGNRAGAPLDGVARPSSFQLTLNSQLETERTFLQTRFRLLELPANELPHERGAGSAPLSRQPVELGALTVGEASNNSLPPARGGEDSISKRRAVSTASVSSS